MASKPLNYGRALRILRALRGWSQKDLAKELTISTAHISLVENNLREPSEGLLERIAELFEVPPQVFALLSSSVHSIRRNQTELSTHLMGQIKE